MLNGFIFQVHQQQQNGYIYQERQQQQIGFTLLVQQVLIIQFVFPVLLSTQKNILQRFTFCI